jgi:hypothetical protein
LGNVDDRCRAGPHLRDHAQRQVSRAAAPKSARHPLPVHEIPHWAAPNSVPVRRPAPYAPLRVGFCSLGRCRGGRIDKVD